MNYLISLTLLAKNLRIWPALGLALIVAATFSKSEAQNTKVNPVCGDGYSISWSLGKGSVLTPLGEPSGKIKCSGETCTVTGLRRGQNYEYYLDGLAADGELIFGDLIELRGPGTGDCPEYIPPTQKPPDDTCSHLPSGIVVRDHLPFATQCQLINDASVSDDELIARGILSAIDVWSTVGADTQVCFPQQGQLYFLDTATTPRVRSALPIQRVQGMTCGRIDRAGQVVLVPGGDSAPESATEVSQDPPVPALSAPTSVTSCEVITTGYLSLRGGPSTDYRRILSMPNGVRLVARARIGDWFMVNYEDQLGWSSGSYLALSPGCEGLGEAGAIILPPVAAAAAGEQPAPEADNTEIASPSGVALADCQVTTADILNLRAGPGLDYEIYAEIPYQLTLSAMAITGDWFMVEYESQSGWVSREYVVRRGICDAASAAVSVNPQPSPESAAPVSDAQDAPAEAERTEITAPAAQALSGCNLRAGDIINLRQGPSLDYNILAEIPNETSLIATARSGDWFEVELEGAMGWVNINYVFRNGACG